MEKACKGLVYGLLDADGSSIDCLLRCDFCFFDLDEEIRNAVAFQNGAQSSRQGFSAADDLPRF